jgi:hypothetical protein
LYSRTRVSLLLRLALALSGLALAAHATRYAGDFEDLGTSARAIGMGGAVVAAAADPSAIYYNPSLCARFERTSEDFSGLVKHNDLGVAIPSRNQSLGLALLHNGIPGIKLTTLPDTTDSVGPDNRPFVYREVSANQLVGYVSVARRLTPLVALGANIKLIYQDLGIGSCFGMGLDAGVTLTPIEDLDVGMRVRNLSTSPLFWDTGTREYVMPSAALGVARTFRFSRDRLTLAVESQADLDGTGMSPLFGLEYGFRNVLFGRLGVYRGNPTFGLGIRLKRFHVDYGYASGVEYDARDLGSPQQISGGIEF